MGAIIAIIAIGAGAFLAFGASVKPAKKKPPAKTAEDKTKPASSNACDLIPDATVRAECKASTDGSKQEVALWSVERGGQAACTAIGAGAIADICGSVAKALFASKGPRETAATWCYNARHPQAGYGGFPTFNTADIKSLVDLFKSDGMTDKQAKYLSGGWNGGTAPESECKAEATRILVTRKLNG